MANCLRCKRRYCDCPVDGYCNECQAIIFSENNNTNIPAGAECSITVEVLNQWKDKLQCVKNSGNGASLGLPDTLINVHLGFVQSGLNYAPNPCYFKDQLETTRSVIQLIILSNLCP